MENKINFLNTAISDAQELIRFIDSKTTVIITILSAYILAFFASLEKIIEYSSGYSFCFWLFLILFFILLIASIVITTRIIKPTNNPIENVTLGNLSNPNLKFFITPNDYGNDKFYLFKNSKKFKLTENFETYLNGVNTFSNQDIIDSLTFELFKVSYIRNIKNDRFNSLLTLLIFTTLSFFISYFFFTIETHNTIESLKTIKNGCCK